MAERLLVLPPPWIPREAGYVIPPVGVALRTLGERLDVEVIHWPALKGGPAVPPTWQAAVQVVREAITPESHVLAASQSVSIALLGLGDGAEARSLIADPLAIPDATLQRLAIPAVAAASSAGYLARSSARWIPDGLRAISEEAAALTDEAVDYAYIDEYLRSWESLDLIAESPHVTIPCLYLDPPAQTTQYPEGEALQLFLRFAPGAEVKQTQLWTGEGSSLGNPGAGEELSNLAVDFINKVAAGTRLLTVLFTDIVDSTVNALEMGDQRWARLLADHHSLVRRNLNAHGGHEVDNAGDGFLATFESPARAVRCAAAITEGVRALGIEVRAGAHTGECEVIGDKVGGVAVHAGARIAATAGPGEVLVSQSVRDLLASTDLQFDAGRTVTLKGLPGEWQLYSLSTDKGN